MSWKIEKYASGLGSVREYAVGVIQPGELGGGNRLLSWATLVTPCAPLSVADS